MRSVLTPLLLLGACSAAPISETPSVALGSFEMDVPAYAVAGMSEDVVVHHEGGLASVGILSDVSSMCDEPCDMTPAPLRVDRGVIAPGEPISLAIPASLIGTARIQGWTDDPPARSPVYTLEVFDPDGDEDLDGISNGHEHVGETDLLVADTDGDGLLDGAELVAGSDPLSSDTDGDGVSDPEELQLGLDPRSSDTDLDGLPDGEEIALGTNPARADSDGDGVGDAEEVLLHGTSPLLADTDGDGLSDPEEFALGTDPTLVDSDTDGLSDGDELILGSEPNNADTDGDGLLDGDERAHGSAWHTADTDGDGRSDGAEVQAGGDPTSPHDAVDISCPPGETLDCVQRCAPVPAADGSCDTRFDCDVNIELDVDCPVFPVDIIGDVRVDIPSDIQALKGVRSLDGVLRIGAGITELVLPRLQSVGRIEMTGASQLRSLVLPALTEAWSGVHIDDAPSLQLVALPGLHDTHEISLRDAPRLLVLDLPGLGVISGLDIQSTDMTVFRADGMTDAQDLRLELPHAHHLGLDALVVVHDLLSIAGEPASLGVPALEQVHEMDLRLGTRTTELSMPRLHGLDRLQVMHESLVRVDLGDAIARVVAWTGPLPTNGPAALGEATEQVSLSAVAETVDLDLSTLSVLSTLELHNAPDLSVLTLPTSLTLETLQVRGAPALVTMAGLNGALAETVRRVEFRSVSLLGQTVDLGETAHISELILEDTDIAIVVGRQLLEATGALEVRNNGLLREVVLDWHAGWNAAGLTVLVKDNPVLERLDAPTTVTSLSSMLLQDNPRWVPCDWYAIRALADTALFLPLPSCP